MIQGGGSLGLTLEANICTIYEIDDQHGYAAQSLSVFGDLVGQELERDKAPKLHIFSLVHYSHTAAAQLLDHAVVRDGLAEHVAPLF
jgi:hypothetical protein